MARIEHKREENTHTCIFSSASRSLFFLFLHHNFLQFFHSLFSSRLPPSSFNRWPYSVNASLFFLALVRFGFPSYFLQTQVPNTQTHTHALFLTSICIAFCTFSFLITHKEVCTKSQFDFFCAHFCYTVPHAFSSLKASDKKERVQSIEPTELSFHS